MNNLNEAHQEFMEQITKAVSKYYSTVHSDAVKRGMTAAKARKQALEAEKVK